MPQDIAIFLCAKTGNAAMPWAQAGYTCYCVDIQHQIRKPRVVQVGAGEIVYVWGDARSWYPPAGRIVFACAFPPCTHLAVSGARDFRRKGGWMLADAIQIFDSCLMAMTYAGCPFYVENPVGRLSSHRRKPDFTFHPWEYAGYLDDIQTDNTSKRTCLWTGGGFVMPEKRPAPPPPIARTAGLLHRATTGQTSARLRRWDLRVRCSWRTVRRQNGRPHDPAPPTTSADCAGRQGRTEKIMKTKHTSAPWNAGRADMATIENGYRSKWIYAGDKYIAVASGRDVDDWDEVMANARLIAAAPELLAACQASIGFDRKVAAEPGVDDGPLSKSRIDQLARERVCVTEMMIAAIAKATGGAS